MGKAGEGVRGSIASRMRAGCVGSGGIQGVNSDPPRMTKDIPVLLMPGRPGEVRPEALWQCRVFWAAAELPHEATRDEVWRMIRKDFPERWGQIVVQVSMAAGVHIGCHMAPRWMQYGPIARASRSDVVSCFAVSDECVCLICLPRSTSVSLPCLSIHVQLQVDPAGVLSAGGSS